jgi:ribosome-associated protein
LALAIATAASDKKALDIVIVKMKRMSSVCDYLVIATGTSTTHTRALSENIIKSLKEKGQPARHVEGGREASWILIDFGDVVCHLFLEETRSFYDLEHLWAKAPQEHFKDKPQGKSKKKVQAKKKAKVKKILKKTKKTKKKRK